MDLRSATAAANWHPLTSYLDFGGAWTSRPFSGMPFLVDPAAHDPFDPGAVSAKQTNASSSGHADPAARRPDGRLEDVLDFGAQKRRSRKLMSTVFHELTHLNSARATRFGWLLGLAGAHAIEAGRKSRDIMLPETTETVLAALTPFLEGLALFAELDFVAEADEIGIPNPVTVYAERIDRFRLYPLSTTFITSIEEAVVEDGASSTPGLLSLLFLDMRHAECSFYLAGYLWIKAAAALIERRCPWFSRPTRMLPFLNRLICDHPAISAVGNGDLDAGQFALAIHQSLIELDEATLDGLASLMAADEAESIASGRSQFDQWDIHEQVRRQQFVELVQINAAGPNEFRQALNSSTGPFLLLARAAAQVHLLRQTTGILKSFDWDAREGVMVDPNNPDAEQKISLLDVNKLWLLLARLSSDDQLRAMAENCPRAVFMQHTLMDLLVKSIGRSITIAEYFTLVHPIDSGLIAWANWELAGERAATLPLTPDAYDEASGGLNLEIVRCVGQVPVLERLDIAKRLVPPKSLGTKRQQALGIILGQLSSSEETRSQIIATRFARLGNAACRQALKRWCAVPLKRARPWRLDDDAAATLERLIDLPGFHSSSGPQIRLRDVLPSIPPSPMA